MIKKWMLSLLFSINFFVCAQIDSISLNDYENLLANAKHDTTKTNLLNKIAEFYINNSDYDKAIEYKTEVLETVDSNKYPEEYIEALISLSYYHNKNRNYKEGLAFSKKAIVNSKKLNNYKIGNAYIEEATSYFYLWKFDSLEVSSHNVIKYSENKKHQINAYNYLGRVYHNKNNYLKAVEMLMNVRRISKELGDIHGSATVLINISIIYSDMNMYSDAIKNLDA